MTFNLNNLLPENKTLKRLTEILLPENHEIKKSVEQIFDFS
jgi:hypothetical protein